MDAIEEVGPGNHYLGSAHTQRNYETAFYASNVADYNSYEQWEAEGSLDAVSRANLVYKDMLNTYEAPAIDPGVDEALREFIDKRKNSFPDSNI